jgi:acetyl-CoA acyltransferase
MALINLQISLNSYKIKSKKIKMNEAYIVDGIRTPIGKFTGTLSPVRADDLAAIPLRELLKRNAKLDPAAISDVIMGCANQAGEDNRNIARMALLLADYPYTVPGETINRLCASGMSATIHAYRAIKANEGDIFVSGGMEHMTRGPWVISKTSTPFGRDAQMYDTSFGWRFINPALHKAYGTDGMGNTAENLAELYKINRYDQDDFSVWSQQKAATAQKSGRLGKEIVPVHIPQRKSDPILFDKDEFIRAETTIEALEKLKPAFRKAENGGTVTAGNASGLNDGAAALLVASEAGIKAHHLQPLARIVSSGVCGVEPRIMGIGPVEASKLALKRAGLTLNDMDIIEFNEAFAVQVLACTRSLGLEDKDQRINPNGGAIALGHPLGMTGARILLTAALELNLTHKRYALVSMCIGVGQGYAVILERP